MTATARNTGLAVTAWATAAVVYVAAHAVDTEFSMFWVFGLAFGFVLQRARFCFASAFRDIFLLGHARTMKGVLLGLAVGSVGLWARHESSGTHDLPGRLSALGQRPAARNPHGPRRTALRHRDGGGGAGVCPAASTEWERGMSPPGWRSPE